MTLAAVSSLSIRDLSCGYGDRTVLRQLDLELPQNHTCALLGPGGAGKSTLLRLLAACRQSDDSFWHQGRVTFRDGQSLGFLGQRILDEGRSVLDLLCTPTRTAEAAESAALNVWCRVPEAQKMLLSLLDLPLRGLPTALARFAALTSVLAEEPELLLLDEPDAEMDGEFRNWVCEQLQNLKGRCTILVTTHHLGLARDVSHDCALLVHGELVEYGPTHDVFQNPRHERTRQFIEMGN